MMLLVGLIFISCGETSNKQVNVTSPDGRIDYVLNVKKDMTYKVTVDDTVLIEPSNLGFVLEGEDKLTSFDIVNVTTEKYSDTWEPVWGQQSTIENTYNEMMVELMEQKGRKRKLNLIVRMYDDGIGFRYELPEQEGIDTIHVMDELTSFKFNEDHTAWWIRNDWDSYEYTYNETPISEIGEASTPVTLATADGLYVSLHEAALIDYAGMALRQTEDLTFEAHLAPWPDGVKVKKENSMLTPWRTIQIGNKPGDLIESSMILNLNEPTPYEDTSWIQPMKYMGIWWEMHIKKSDWGQHNLNHGATTENAKYYIDFISEYLSDKEPIGLLVEGWNQGWDGNWIDNYDLFKFTEDGEYDDFDVSEVVAYGQERNVAYIMHNETSGGIENYDAAMDDAYGDYQRLGIHAIKSGYVADGGMKQPRGQHHHGQYMVNHYNNAVIKAADYEIMINTHEPIKPTGLSRTYPNWVAREGVQGMEYNAWSEGNPPEHTTILPFTRILGGPIDYTPGIFDVEVGGNTYRVHTTRAKQLALYVVLYSPLQMITDLPENYLDENGVIYPEFKFIRDVAVDWDETKVLDAAIGDYVAIARKAKGEDAWYVGAITDEEARVLELPLDFLGEGKYKAEVYADAAGTDYLTEPNNVLMYDVILDNEQSLMLEIPESGGVAMRIVPATAEDIKNNLYNTYTPLEIKDMSMVDKIQSNDAFSVDVTVKNNGSVVSGETLAFMIDGEEVYNKYVRVEPNTEKVVSFEYDEFFEPGTYDIKVGNFNEKALTVEAKPATFELKDFEVFVKENKAMTRVKIVNTGYEVGVYTVNLYINDELIESKDVEVESAPGGKTKGITIRYDLTASGPYKINLEDFEYEFEHELK